MLFPERQWPISCYGPSHVMVHVMERLSSSGIVYCVKRRIWPVHSTYPSTIEHIWYALERRLQTRKLCLKSTARHQKWIAVYQNLKLKVCQMFC